MYRGIGAGERFAIFLGAAMVTFGCILTYLIYSMGLEHIDRKVIAGCILLSMVLGIVIYHLMCREP